MGQLTALSIRQLLTYLRLDSDRHVFAQSVDWQLASGRWKYLALGCRMSILRNVLCKQYIWSLLVFHSSSRQKADVGSPYNSMSFFPVSESH